MSIVDKLRDKILWSIWGSIGSKYSRTYPDYLRTITTGEPRKTTDGSYRTIVV